MKALTVRQPWAHALIHLGKGIENRSWQTKHRGDLAIHAAGSVTRPEIQRAINGEFWHPSVDPLPIDDLALGAIIGVVSLKSIHHSADCIKPGEHGPTYCTPWAMPRLFHWEVEPLLICDPYPIKGSLQVWNLPTIELTGARRAG